MATLQRAGGRRKPCADVDVQHADIRDPPWTRSCMGNSRYGDGAGKGSVLPV